ncbi:MAG: heme A synthase [Gemmatimonadales bacterium]|nr:MAG: heme A synthase [Gemmatimonadales bacterium]
MNLDTMSPETRRRVGTWLAIWAAMVLVLVLIGGATRLTESGLSITEWKPVTGVLPPLDHAAWEAEFARYQQIPEYQQLNMGMTLAQFQVIYLWEFSHRLWARLVGLALALPLAFFLWRREVRGALAWRIGGILLLTGLQGAMGWYMVKSGLTVRTDVSQYRLAAHLALALVVYALAVWTGAELLGYGPRRTKALDPMREASLRRRTAWFAAFVFVTIMSGAFVAGLDAGHAWNTFPLMGGRVVPPGYAALSPWYLNLFENIAAVQFHHRLLGLTVALLSVLLWRFSRGVPLPGGSRRWFAALAVLAALQMVLGIATLLLHVPVPVAVLHQLGAVLVLTAALLALASLQTKDGRQDSPAVLDRSPAPPVSSR